MIERAAMIERSSQGWRVAAIAMSVICSAGFGTAVAQTTSQPQPSVNQTNSDADMKDTVNDPRIAKSRSTQSGEWKWAVPPVKMKGAFDNNDPIGVLAGKKIPADCSINWRDPDTHQLFCFSSATSLVYFLDAPKSNTARAEKAWRAMKGAPTG